MRQKEPGFRGPAIRLEEVGKVFRTDDVETHALSSVTLDLEQGEFCFYSWTVGLWQVNTSAHNGDAACSKQRYAFVGGDACSESFWERTGEIEE